MKSKQTFFAKQLKNIMLEQCLTQKNLAEKVGVGQQLISFWLTGKRNPTVTSVKKVAQALDIPISYFIENSDKTKKLEKNNGLDEKDIKILQLENRLLKLEQDHEARILKLEKEVFS